MRVYVLLLVLLVTALNGKAQVGVNTTNPQATLDVNGTVKIDGKLYLENPGPNTTLTSSNLLIRTTGGAIVEYDIDIAKYGPINYVQYIFQRVNPTGLLDYDTKISISKYITTVQGYYFQQNGTNNPEVVLQSTVNTNKIEGYQVYAYKNTTTNTWWLRAFGNNSLFKAYFGSPNFDYLSTYVDIYLNVVIYRAGFISKEQGMVNVNAMNNDGSNPANPLVAPLPIGFQ